MSAEAKAYETTKQRAVSAGRMLFARHLAVAAISVVGSTFLIRALGPADWATYSIGYYLVVFFDTTLVSKVLGHLIRAVDTPEREDVATASRLMQIVGASLFVFFAAICIPAAKLYGRSDFEYVLLAVGACAYAYSTRAVSAALLERSIEYRAIAVADVVDQVSFYLIAIPLVIAGAGVGGVAVALALRGVLPAVLLRHRRPTPWFGSMDSRRVRRILDFGVPSLLLSIAILLDGLVPTFVLGGSHAVELAFVMTSGTIIGYALTAAVVAQRVSFPGLSSLQSSPSLFRTALHRLVVLTNCAVITPTVPMAALGTVWLPLLFGRSWERAGIVMAVLGSALLVSITTLALSAALASRGHARDTLGLQLLITLVYLGLSLVLAPQWVLLGVPVACLASRVIGLATTWNVLSWRGVHVAIAGPVAQLAIAGAVTIGTSALIDHGMVPAGILLLVLAGVAWLLLARRELVVLARAAWR
jgi:O-antigen/teichoic acid export membrane protein